MKQSSRIDEEGLDVETGEADETRNYWSNSPLKGETILAGTMKTSSRVDGEETEEADEKAFLISNTEGSQYGSSALEQAPDHIHTFRFQVVVWYVGPVDVVHGKVDMKFRVTIFWNAPPVEEKEESEASYGTGTMDKKVWVLHGRQRAYERSLSELIAGSNKRLVFVPPVSILNAVDFEIVGDPEVCLINKKRNLMRWSCLYKATLHQGTMNVANFPHDVHDLVLRFGILRHRQSGKRWDRNVWKLSLATAEDTQDSIEVPYGLIVSDAQVPSFSYDSSKGLQFEFAPLDIAQKDQCLQVKLRVTRTSSYYDKNIIRLLAALNTVAISTLALRAKKFSGRGGMILATAFVEIGLRLTVDSRLPNVGYQIKMQVVLNNFFFGLLFLVLESSIVYLMQEHGYEAYTRTVDRTSAAAELVHMVVVLLWYYSRYNS